MGGQRPLARLTLRLIDDWRRGWRFWSVRLQALTVACAAGLAAAPDLAQIAWLAIPADLRARLPGDLALWLTAGFGALAIVARFIKQSQERNDA